MTEHLPSHLDHLIVVAGHAVYVADNFADPLADAAWCLQPYQRGEPPFYLEHIRRGVELAAADERALLIFAGGPSRREAGPHSEAQSYERLAAHFQWWGRPEVGSRAATEEFSRDSFENLIFSIGRFRECVGRYPQRITAVSWQFKAARFDHHRATLRFPWNRFVFVGVNNPPKLTMATKGEERALALFAADPYGCHGELAAKRAERNPFQRRHSFAHSCPELAALLEHRGPELIEGVLPWG